MSFGDATKYKDMFLGPFLTLALIPATFSRAIPLLCSSPRTDDLVAIRQTINLFTVLADSYRYSELSRVFTSDCVVDFGESTPVLHGIAAVQKVCQTFEGRPSQHALTTQYIELTSPTTADAESYVIANFFDEGDNVPPNFTEYGK
ncbi:MAG: hypothetical protein Q9195_004598 [Heterodermia aff. obscurata]